MIKLFYDIIITGPSRSLSTRDKLGVGPLSLIQWSLSTRDKLGVGPLSLIQWSLSTRDKLGVGPLQWSLYKGQVGGGSSAVEPLYKGQVGGWVLCSGASLQGTSCAFVPYTVEPLSTRDKVGRVLSVHGASLQGTRSFVPGTWVVLSSEVTDCSGPHFV